MPGKNTIKVYIPDSYYHMTSKTIQRTLANLKNRGLVSRVGSDKTGHWVS